MRETVGYKSVFEAVFLFRWHVQLSRDPVTLCKCSNQYVTTCSQWNPGAAMHRIGSTHFSVLHRDLFNTLYLFNNPCSCHIKGNGCLTSRLNTLWLSHAHACIKKNIQMKGQIKLTERLHLYLQIWIGCQPVGQTGHLWGYIIHRVGSTCWKRRRWPKLRAFNVKGRPNTFLLSYAVAVCVSAYVCACVCLPPSETPDSSNTRPRFTSSTTDRNTTAVGGSAREVLHGCYQRRVRALNVRALVSKMRDDGYPKRLEAA